MKLTEKANIDFYTWVNKEYPNVIFERASGGFGEVFCYDIFMEDVFDIDIIGDIALNALIIEWLDNIEIYITIEGVFDRMAGYHRGFEVHIYQEGKQPISIFNNNDVFETRIEATKAAIEKANEIYNTQHFAQ